MIFNYPIRIRTSTEERRLTIIKNTRKIELLEKLTAIENRMKEMIKNDAKKSEATINEKWREALDEHEYSKQIENYVMNRVKGKPEYVDDDSIK